MSIEEKRLEGMVGLLKALAHPIRLGIVSLIAEHYHVDASLVREHLNLSQGLASHHLIKMRDIGLLKSQRQAQKVCYSLADDSLLKVLNLLRQ